MKTFQELTSEQKKKALDKLRQQTIEALLEGLEFDDRNLQEQVNQAIKKADDLQTPWFAGDCINDAIGSQLDEIVQAEAESSFYEEPHENIIKGVI